MYKPKDRGNASLSAGKDFCAFIFIALSSELYHDPERVANNLAKHREIENVDVVAGRWGLVLRVRTKDQGKFYDFLRKIVCKENGVARTSSIVSLKQVKPICLALD